MTITAGHKSRTNPGLKAIVLMPGWWSPRRGHRTHAAVVPADFREELGAAYETLCGRGRIRNFLGGLKPVLEGVDCPGCWNALVLGGFLEDYPHQASDWSEPVRMRRATVVNRYMERWESAAKRERGAAVERDLNQIRAELKDAD